MFFDRSQTLTEAQKGQAKSNIGAGSTNPNLLINGWFTVNTRNTTTVTTGFIVDNWTIESGSGSASVNSGGGLDITGATGTSVQLRSYISDDILRANLGKQMVLSVRYSPDSADTASCTIPTTIPTSTITLGNKSTSVGSVNFAFSAAWQATSNRIMIVLRPYGGTVTVRAVKLEMGTNSTILNDTQPDYNEELIRCESNNVYSSDAFANKIVTATSNRNLLDNWWFREGVINQRGFTSYSGTGNGYIIMDRWIGSYGDGATGLENTLNAYGYTQKPLNGTGRAIIQQRLTTQVKATIKEQAITASIKLQSGTIVTGTIKRAAGYAQSFFDQTVDGARLVCQMATNDTFNIYSCSK